MVNGAGKLDAAAGEDDGQGGPISGVDVCFHDRVVGCRYTVAGLAIRERVVEQRKSTQAAGLVQAVLTAETAQVPAVIGEMARYRKWADPLLREEIHKATATPRQRLHASLALLPVDATQVDYLLGRLLDAEPQVPVIRDALAWHKGDLLNSLWGGVIWSAACSTGEEPYSLAMVLDDYSKQHPEARLEFHIGGYRYFA